MKNHIPVMSRKVVEFLKPERGGTFVDCTLGAGGHSAALLQQIRNPCPPSAATSGAGRRAKSEIRNKHKPPISKDKIQIIGIDQDMKAIELAKKNLKEFEDQIKYVNDNYININQILSSYGVEKADGILFDLGVSSMQLADQSRGFSFSTDAPLDMRMNQTKGKTTFEIVNSYREKELADLIFQYGEERFSRQIAKAIVEERRKEKIDTTKKLVETIERAVPISYVNNRRIHFATRTFQALRIETNDELVCVRKGIKEAIALLEKGGRIVVISFHSLEDRIVKNIFRQKKNKELKILTKKPLRPSLKEIKSNPRSRSAKLRAAEKLS